MSDEPIRKANGSGQEVLPRPARLRMPRPSPLRVVASIPSIAVLGLVVGVGLRITVIMFEFGWDLFGWA